MKAGSWVGLVARSAAGAALVGAAELGIASALGLLAWPVRPPGAEAEARTTLWVVFIFATAVLGGIGMSRDVVRAIRAAIASRRALAAVTRGSVRRATLAAVRSRAVDAARGTAAALTRVVAAVTAAAGAAATFALIWFPARGAAMAPGQLRELALDAAIGVLLGTMLGLAALTAAPIAVAVAATAVWVWAFGIMSVWLAGTGPDQAPGQADLGPPRLGVLDAPHLIEPTDWWLGPYLMVVIAVIIGASIAATARWIGSRRLAVALSGVAGPALVAAGYLVAGPTPALTSAYIASLLAATAGLVASTAIATREPAPHTQPEPAALPASPPAAGALPQQRPAAALPAGSAPSSAGTARAERPLAIEAASTPTPVTLDAEYAATQPDRGHPLFEVNAAHRAAVGTQTTQTTSLAIASDADGSPGRDAPPPTAAEEPSRAAEEPSRAAKEPSRAAKEPSRAAEEPSRAAEESDSPTEQPAVASSRKTSAATRSRNEEHGAVAVARRRVSRRQRRREHYEREHVDWVRNLINTPSDPALNGRPRS